MYAVIKTGGKQHRVSPGDIVEIEKIHGNKGDSVCFDEVLLISRDEEVRVGTPFLTGAKVSGEIVEQTKARKINVFKMKRRKGYKKKTGHRQQLTRMKIKEISI
ncbi:MAG TPA: 50S ribosomal protein L21 [Syntrophaceae bacterium]|jgi:large subunit ribosomal protein L21|nr:50S ribosomal protein L21 [Syntrophaceae bacterium]